MRLVKAEREGQVVHELQARSDVIGFISQPDDSHGAHAAILTDADDRGCFPPNCLFRLHSIVPAGAWEAPGGVWPQQRLLVVTATYKPPRELEPCSPGRGKMCGAAHQLQYGARDVYIHGLERLMSTPTLPMAREFDRGREADWADWKGVVYSLRTEWRYAAVGPAVRRHGCTPHRPACKCSPRRDHVPPQVRRHGCTPGTRDALNEGKRPADFLAEANGHIRARREAGLTGGIAPDFAYLTLEEVVALRLYTGPAHIPINRFLRQLAVLEDARYRAAVAQHADITFAATVQHLCSAIRKLAAVVTPEEAAQPLYRGVRGELPRSFWLPDEKGMLVATETGFMSTSRSRSMPVGYLDPFGANLLWKIRPTAHSDSGFHHGAPVSLLSQFADEEEVRPSRPADWS